MLRRGFAPQYIDSLSFGEALRAMRLVGGSSNAAALMEFSTANADALALVASDLPPFAVAAIYTHREKSCRRKPCTEV